MIIQMLSARTRKCTKLHTTVFLMIIITLAFLFFHDRYLNQEDHQESRNNNNKKTLPNTNEKFNQVNNNNSSSSRLVSRLCEINTTNLLGRIEIQKEPLIHQNWTEIEGNHKELLPGGYFQPQSPQDCISTQQKLAIVVPFRNRDSHLRAFLSHMHPFLQRQQLSYQIFVIEQADDLPFNVGELQNIGFLEAMKFQENFTCFIFHAVDLLPENDQNLYFCQHDQAVHLCAAADSLNYKLIYDQMFGGAVALPPRIFQLVNGYANSYWGWGAEDDDMYTRLCLNNFTISRPKMDVGRYTMLKHAKPVRNPERFWVLRAAIFNFNETQRTISADGLTSVSYSVLNRTLYQSHTLITVKLSKNERTNGNSSFINMASVRLKEEFTNLPALVQKCYSHLLQWL